MKLHGDETSQSSIYNDVLRMFFLSSSKGKSLVWLLILTISFVSCRDGLFNIEEFLGKCIAY